MVAEKLEELDALAQAPLHHLRAPDHFADDGRDFRDSEIEAPVEGFDRMKDFGVAEMRVMQRRDLDARGVDQLGVAGIEPAILHGLIVEGSAGIGSGDRDLNRMRIDLGREANRLLDGLAALARQTKHESTVNRYTELVAVLGEGARDVDPHPLLDVVQD